MSIEFVFYMEQVYNKNNVFKKNVIRFYNQLKHRSGDYKFKEYSDKLYYFSVKRYMKMVNK